LPHIILNGNSNFRLHEEHVISSTIYSYDLGHLSKAINFGWITGVQFPVTAEHFSSLPRPKSFDAYPTSCTTATEGSSSPRIKWLQHKAYHSTLFNAEGIRIFGWLWGPPSLLSWGIKRLQHKDDHSTPCSAKVKNVWSFILILLTCLHGMVLRHRANFMFTFHTDKFKL
jgi:hypothetical protein